MRSLSFLLLALTSVFVLIASFGSTPAKSDDVGYLLYRTFLVFKSQPLNASEAINQGWEQYADCDDNYGIAYAYVSTFCVDFISLDLSCSYVVDSIPHMSLRVS